MARYCKFVGSAALPDAPSAVPKMTLYASTSVCTLPAVLACVPVMSRSFKALFMAPKFCAVTPLTPKAAYCATVGLVAVALLFCAAV